MKKTAFASFVIAALIGSCIPVYAASEIPESPKSAYACIQSKYSAGIEIREKDYFDLTYASEDGTEDSIRIDASLVYSDPQILELEQGSYVITDIAYSGENDQIEDVGYAVTPDFSAQENGSSYIILAIGESQINRLENTYENVLIKQNGDYVGSLIDQNQETVGEPEETGMEEPDQTVDTTQETVNQQSSSETKPIIEDYRQETKDTQIKSDSNSRSLFMRGVPILIMSVIFGIGVYIAHKNGKI